ncbi:MAG: hypothetical protein RUMPE_00378 [Eubacteriales bacterium SKADARSKE-1]|nr:hypothetical protein [Eubacteriales bacterium SKADARSKE-1]
MIVALTIKKIRNENWFSKIMALVCPNKINFEKKTLGPVKLLHITINQRNKRIPWKKLSKILKKKTQNILCQENTKLPKKYGFSRYNSTCLKKVLCKNAAVNVLKLSNINPNKLKLSLFDPKAEHSEILKELILFSNQVNVVTYNTSKYLKDQEKMMAEYGASIVGSDNLDLLFKSNVVIAPNKIMKTLPISQSCLVFTSERSSAPLKGIIYHDYKISVPQIFNSIMPPDLDPEYFLSAVYDKYNICEIKQIIPKNCLCENKELSIKDIASKIFYEQ